MVAEREFSVRVNKKEVVSAALPIQRHCLRQSNLDLLLPPLTFGVFFCYQKTHKFFTFGYISSALKAALAESLVYYYALAGEVVQNRGGEAELLCNNRGVEFAEAFADIELNQLNLFNPDESVENKLVPCKKHGVLAVQVTELKCGGVVVGCSFDHRVADAYSANMFLVSWSEVAQAKPLSQLPCFRRSFLFPRRPGHYDLSIDAMYTLISSLPPPAAAAEPQALQTDEQSVISRIYYIESEEIIRIQSLANSQKGSAKHHRITKLQAFSAFLWKTIAAGIMSRKDYSFKNFKLGVVVDGRTRLSDGDELLKGYFGNVLSIPFGDRKIEDLQEKPLSWVANAVREFLEEAVTREHFLGLIDWVEAHRPEPALAKIYAGGEGPAVVVSSGQQFPVRKIDFGWGKPVFGSYHFHWGGQAGYVMPMPSPKGNGDWIVYMHLQKWEVELIEAHASHVFKPMTSEYLDLN
ncbi:PREDICTED: shikimate O-hydroxycinnamoyltransferase-like [Ipomoea nil]|uniref:shikimate O-hydroxycinnamoyltransferase-like n=1 Tax=Ipomoea nil TaxID=35883 RepID=UPI000901C1D9|nr:PREDICTED: shikimate O-hydroxycinnamoyltransferase-like [Ipomoea nil]